jgi:hypothetical protein
MPKAGHQAVPSPQSEEGLFNLVTRPEQIEKHVEVLLGKIPRSDDPSLDELSEADYRLHTGDPIPMAKWYLARRGFIPKWLGDLIVASNEPKRDGRHGGGRHARPEAKARQLARDFACFFAVSDLMTRGMRRTPAEEKTAEAMGLRRQAVHGACEREKRRLAGRIGIK